MTVNTGTPLHYVCGSRVEHERKSTCAHYMPRNPRAMNYDVLANTLRTWITSFRMVAERAVHRTVRLHGRRHKEPREAEQGLHCKYRVNSALLVEPTYMDPTSGSTTTWSTGSINMLSSPKQTSHKRDLPAMFEGISRMSNKDLLLHSIIGPLKYRSTCH
eukprot:823730-Amphidinium_carterae.1